MEPPASKSSSRNLLASESPGDWERLLEALALPAILVLIGERMGSRLREWYQPEDVLQEGLLHAWRDREKLEWRGVAAFRRWFLAVLDNRLKDLADQVVAQKRGGGMPRRTIDAEGCSDPFGVPGHVVAVTTTPGRRVALLEQAELLARALHALPEDLQDVVRLRLLEERSTAETAAELRLGISAVKHRLRAGAGLLRAHLHDEYSSLDRRS